MERFDLFDKHGNKLDKTMLRGSKCKPGEYHKVVHIWIQNAKDEFLVQQRNKASDLYPYQWAPTAGAVIAGETALEAVIRETKEEIGVLLKREEIIYKDTFFIEQYDTNYIIEVFLIHRDVDLNTCVIDKTEVKQIAYMSKKEILQRIRTKTFWDFLSLWPKIDYFRALRRNNEHINDW